MPDFPYDCGFIGEATITVRFDIDRAGRVRYPQAVAGSEARCPAALIVDTVSRWRYEPRRSPTCGATVSIRLSPGGPDGMIEACAATLARPEEHTAGEVRVCEREVFRAKKWKAQLRNR